MMSNPTGSFVRQQNDNGGGHGDGPEEIKSNLIVNYLPHSMTQEEIRSLFATIGLVTGCKLMRDKGTDQSLGYAFVNYHQPEDAEKAIDRLNGLKLQNKMIKVSYARPSSAAIKGANLYICGLPKDMTQQDLEALFSPYGQIISSRILRENVNVGHEFGSSKGVGFIRFNQRAEAEEALELNGTVPEGFTDPITVRFANNPGQNNRITPPPVPPPPVPPYGVSQAARPFPGPIHHNHNPASRFRYSPMASEPRYSPMAAESRYSPMASEPMPSSMPSGNATNNPKWSLFVFNIAPETEESILWRLFGPFGAVQDVKIIRDPTTNKGKGFAFVNMCNYDEATAAVQALDGYTLENRVLQVSFKTSKSKNA